MSIVVVLLGCILLWFVVTSPRFRKITVLLGVFVAAGGGVWYLLDQEPPKTQSIKFVSQPPVSYADQMEIPADELAVSGIAIHQPEDVGQNYKISGKIRNSSKTAALTSVKMEITVSNCPPQSRCVTVGESTVQIRADVPPGEAKDFKYELTRLRGLPAGRNLSWNWTVTASYAKQAR